MLEEIFVKKSIVKYFNIKYSMSFFDDIKYNSLLGETTGHSAVLFGDVAVYVEGISQVISISQNKIELSARKRILTVEGNNLYIDVLEKESIIIKGEILCFSQNR